MQGDMPNGSFSAAVFVIGPDGTITYAEYVNHRMLEPDYDAAVAAARSAARA